VNDADLIQRFIAGQPQVFNTLVWRWQGRLYNFVLRYAGNPEDARNLCQQRFIRVHRQRHRLRNPERFGTWLYQIAANLCRDHLRHRQSRTSLDAYQEENGQPHPALSDDTHHSPTNEFHRTLLARDLETRRYQDLQLVGRRFDQFDHTTQTRFRRNESALFERMPARYNDDQ